MPKRSPLPDWSDSDVFIIGGGPSLRGFDFQKLKGLNTIGCNQAFQLGHAICNICTFGDFKFFNTYETGFVNGKGIEELGLDTYRGWVATNYQGMRAPDWLKTFKRQDEGLNKGDTLGWNFNTGALAINLALVLGAVRVYLLGFDCGPIISEEQDSRKLTHWHDNAIDQVRDQHYKRFMEGFENVRRAMPLVFPGPEIFNVTDGSSALKTFPCMGFDKIDFSPR